MSEAPVATVMAILFVGFVMPTRTARPISEGFRDFVHLLLIGWVVATIWLATEGI